MSLSPKAVPLLDLQAEVTALRAELDAAIDRVLRSGTFIGGPEVDAFEAEAAAYLGVRHAIGLNSGTDALVIALEALGVGPGDEVITAAFSFFATSEAIMRLGATPVFCDIDTASYDLDPALLEPLVTPRTRAVVPVHLFGRPAAMGAVLEFAERHGLAVVEDCAQAFGARCSELGGRRVGSLGVMGAFSFYPTKNLGAYGDGGLLTTDDDDLARAVRSLRNHGSSPADKYSHERLGHNSRLDALQAAILRVKLPHVDDWNRLRREVAACYREVFARTGLVGVEPPVDHHDHVYHQFTVRVGAGERGAYEAALSAAGVGWSRFYPTALTAQPVGSRFGSAPVAEDVAGRVLSLPMRPSLSRDDVAAVTGALLGAVAA